MATLPTELQSKIIQMLNISDYANAYCVPFITKGFSCEVSWKHIDLEDFAFTGIPEDFIELFKQFGHLVKIFEWHDAPQSAIIDQHVTLTYMPNLTTIDLSNNLSITNL